MIASEIAFTVVHYVSGSELVSLDHQGQYLVVAVVHSQPADMSWSFFCCSHDCPMPLYMRQIGAQMHRNSSIACGQSQCCCCLA